MGEKPLSDSVSAWQAAFLEQHRLDGSYIEEARRWFVPLARTLALDHAGAVGAPRLIGVNGSQGSGKTTACAYLSAWLQAQCGLRVLAVSLDDFYLTRAQRRKLASTVHPLLATRGVPGTHDMRLLSDTLDALLAPSGAGLAAIPRFDKARDDRCARAQWEEVAGGVDLVLLEGWCLGARPQSTAELQQAVNELERDEDPDLSWREYVNTALRRDFLPLYERVDAWVMLQAPSFACVYQWRLEQEHKLSRSAPEGAAGVMNDAQLERFIRHYQRLTEHCLATLPLRVDYLYILDDTRRISASRPRWSDAP